MGHLTLSLPILHQLLRIEAFREPVTEDLMLEYLERLRQIGFSTVIRRLAIYGKMVEGFPCRVASGVMKRC